MGMKGCHPLVSVIFVLTECSGSFFANSQTYWLLALLVNGALLALVPTKSIGRNYLAVLSSVVCWGLIFLSLIHGVDHFWTATSYCHEAISNLISFEGCLYAVGTAAIQMFSVGVAKAIPILVPVSLVAILAATISSDKLSILALR